MRSRAIIFFAHGSRDPLWQAPMQAIAQRAQALDPLVIVRLAYLELSEPSLPDVVAELLASDPHPVTDITIMPLFLGMGRHARQDLPDMLAALRVQHPGAVFRLLPALGENPRLIDLAAQLALQPAPGSSLTPETIEPKN